MRINKFLALSCNISRRKADEYVINGQVRIGGRVARPGDDVSSDEEVYLNNTPVEYKTPDTVILAFNKPSGYVCSESDKDGPSIFKLIDYPKRLFYVGRLDMPSRGLILLSNDGDFSNRLMKSVNKHEREYIVHTKKVIDKEFIQHMRNGVYLRDLEVKTRPCFVQTIGDKSFRIILTQGLNRQIRRMCKELGQSVIDLQRIRIENIELGKLKEGNIRKISGESKERLLSVLK